MSIISTFVDRLPIRLWKPGNVWTLLGHNLHFCVDAGLRTIEWDNRVVARGSLRLVETPEEAFHWRETVTPWIVDALPGRLWASPGRSWLDGRIVFEVEHGEDGGAQRVVDLWGRVGALAGRYRQVGSRGPQWFGVRCVFRDASRSLYEERVTLWRAAGFAEALAMAEVEAADYATTLDLRYVGLGQAYWLPGRPVHGAEVFSLCRDSELAPTEYLGRFFDTGRERQGGNRTAPNRSRATGWESGLSEQDDHRPSDTKNT